MGQLWIATLTVVVALAMDSEARLTAEKRCQSICQVTELDEQCKYCNARSPVRFGKRSKELFVTLRSSSVDSPRQNLGALARLLSERARYLSLTSDET